MSPSRCHLFCCSAFTTYTDSPVYHAPSLTNDIHPIFSPGRFPAEIEYPVLEPSLRLASHLLKLDNATRLIHTLTHGGLYVNLVGNAMMKVDFTELDALRKESEVDACGVEKERTIWPKVSRFSTGGGIEVIRDDIENFLIQAKDMVEFQFGHEVRKAAKTNAIDGPLHQTQAAYFPRGCMCTISFCLADYEAIKTKDQDDL